MNFYKTFLDGFAHLLFPSHCIVCNGELALNEGSCCSICKEELAFTYFETTLEETKAEKLFWGRAKLKAIYAMLYYEKTNTTKPILEALKYHNRPDVGLEFGKMIGHKLKSIKAFYDVDALIPVPIHPRKKYIRGYNQSEQLAKGISEQFHVFVDKSSVYRTKNTKSQTKLGRFIRWDNVQDMFALRESIKGYKHVAIVDDVITTGSTIESIVQKIEAFAPHIQISVVSLAITK